MLYLVIAGFACLLFSAYLLYDIQVCGGCSVACAHRQRAGASADRPPALTLLSAACGVLPSAQLVMGGRYYSISPDEYIFAALNIYLVSRDLTDSSAAAAFLGRRQRTHANTTASMRTLTPPRLLCAPQDIVNLFMWMLTLIGLASSNN